MHKSTRIGFLVVLIVLLTAPMAFSQGQKADADSYEVVTVVKITGIPWFNRLEEGVQAAKTELGLNAYQIGPAQQVKIVDQI